MKSIQEIKIEHKLTYFDVVRALDEGLAIGIPLFACDPNQLDMTIWQVQEPR